MDKNPGAVPTHCFDVARVVPWPLSADTYDEVLGIHVVEHFSQGKVEQVFREVLRVLKPGGRFRAHVPNGELIARVYCEHPEKRVTLQMAIFGAEAEFDPRYAHKVLYDESQLRAVFVRSGFVNVRAATEEFTDHHDTGWAHLGGKISLKMIGEKG